MVQSYWLSHGQQPQPLSGFLQLATFVGQPYWPSNVFCIWGSHSRKWSRTRCTVFGPPFGRYSHPFDPDLNHGSAGILSPRALPGSSRSSEHGMLILYRPRKYVFSVTLGLSPDTSKPETCMVETQAFDLFSLCTSMAPIFQYHHLTS